MNHNQATIEITKRQLEAVLSIVENPCTISFHRDADGDWWATNRTALFKYGSDADAAAPGDSVETAINNLCANCPLTYRADGKYWSPCDGDQPQWVTEMIEKEEQGDEYL